MRQVDVDKALTIEPWMIYRLSDGCCAFQTFLTNKEKNRGFLTRVGNAIKDGVCDSVK